MKLETLAVLTAAVVAAAPLAGQRTLEIGATVAGTLDEGDPQMSDGSHYDSYAIRGRPGQTVMIRMNSEDFDTYLHWGYGTNPDWVEVAGNDDWGGSDSRLVVRLGDDGEYELRAAGYDEEELGAYELTVTEMRPPPVSGTIRPGQTVEGDLAETDYDGVGGYQDHYAIRGRDGDTITIYLQSDEFDPLVVFGLWRNGEVDLRLEDDDSGRGTSAELVTAFYNQDEHRIVVRSYAGDQTGRYTLRVVAGAAPEGWDDEEDDGWVGTDSAAVDTTVWTDATVTTTDTVAATSLSDALWAVVPLPGGSSMPGWLDEASRADEEGGYFQEFTYEAREGDRILVQVVSEDMDPYVLVGTGTHDEFEAFAADDDGGDGLNAELEWTAPRDGVYTIRVTAATPGETGTFTLTVQTR